MNLGGKFAYKTQERQGRGAASGGWCWHRRRRATGGSRPKMPSYWAGGGGKRRFKWDALSDEVTSSR